MIKAILKRIGERFDCTISVAAGPKFSSVIRLARIEWVRNDRAARPERNDRAERAEMAAIGTEPSHA
jgi:hypothetical protein